MPEETIDGQVFDCFVLCVDRFTGWILAQPTRKGGLTGEKAAKLLWNNFWGEIVIPAIITTDQDPRFTSSYFQTICSLAGCWVAVSQAQRPQANGRAEVAGKLLRDKMRKSYVE